MATTPDPWSPSRILARLATHKPDRMSAIYARQKLVAEQDVAYSELESRFKPRWDALDAQDEELDFLGQIQVIDGCPLHVENDRGLTTMRSFGEDGKAHRTALFKNGPGESTLGINAGPGKDGFQSFHFSSASLAHGHALRWLVDGVVPPDAYNVTRIQPTPPEAPSV
jgi:hypothetical protein